MGGAAGQRPTTWLRTTAVVGVAALVSVLCTACQPRDGEVDVTNRTDQTLWDGWNTLRPGETVRYRDAREYCLVLPMFATLDMRYVVASPGEFCDGDDVDITESDLRTDVASATVANKAAAGVYASFSLSYGLDERWVPAGEALAVPMLALTGECLDEPIMNARVPEGELLYAPPPLCDGDVWVIDDATVTDGSAMVTVINETGYTYDLSAWTDAGSLQVELEGWSEITVPLGVPAGSCADGTISVRPHYVANREPHGAELTGQLCEREWVIDYTVVYDPGDDEYGMVPGVPAQPGETEEAAP